MSAKNLYLLAPTMKDVVVSHIKNSPYLFSRTFKSCKIFQKLFRKQTFFSLSTFSLQNYSQKKRDLKIGCCPFWMTYILFPDKECSMRCKNNCIGSCIATVTHFVHLFIFTCINFLLWADTFRILRFRVSLAYKTDVKFCVLRMSLDLTVEIVLHNFLVQNDSENVRKKHLIRMSQK